MSIEIMPNHLYIEFIDKTDDRGEFIDDDVDGLLIPKSFRHQVHGRWARITNKGSQINSEYDIGDYVFLDSLRWTKGISYDGNKIWRADPKGILSYIKSNTNNIDINNFKYFKSSRTQK